MIWVLLTLVVCMSLAAQNPSPSMPAPDAPNATPQTASQTPDVPAMPGQIPTTAKSVESAPAGILEGKVKSGNTAIPGATVGATNPATGQNVVGWTQTDGSYQLALRATGEYVVRVQMTGFAIATQHVNVSSANPHPRLDLQITLLSRAQSATAGDRKSVV